MAETKRGQALSIFAVLFALLAVSNLLKPLQLGGEQITGFVFFGQRLAGTANTIVVTLPILSNFTIPFQRNREITPPGIET